MENILALDIVLGVAFVWAMFSGFRKGLIIKVASIVALVAGVYAGFHFSSFAGARLNAQFDWSANTLAVGAFVVTFLGVVLGVHLLAKLLEKVVDITALSLVNKLGGMALGFLQMLVLLSGLAFALDSVFGHREWLPKAQVEGSILYPSVESAVEYIIPETNRDTPWETIQSRLRKGAERLEEAAEDAGLSR
jgi:membrane protein required for colicin V production